MGKLSKLKLRQLKKAEREANLLKVLQENKVRHSNSKKVLERIINQELKHSDFPVNSGMVLLTKFIQENNGGQRNHFIRLLELLFSNKGKVVLEDQQLVEGLWNMSKYAGRWIRKVESWKPKFYNRPKLFNNLSNHLLAKYSVPSFLNEGWLESNSTYMNWFLHIGEGQNIRTATNLPVKFTKKMAHQFLKAPAHYSINEAIRYTQVIGMGGSKQLVPFVLGTRIGRGFENEDFVETLIRFFIKNASKLNPADIQPIVDYVYIQKFETRQLVVERGVYETLPPAQPDFSMKGRTVEALLGQVKEWHEELARKKRRRNLITWSPFHLNDFILKKEGKTPWQGDKIYRIVQLLTSKELFQEGRAMHHCVGRYANSCRTGRISIWSMTVQEDFNKPERLVTIELDKHKNIRQVRGKYNAWASPEVIEVIKKWCEKSSLKFPHRLNN